MIMNFLINIKDVTVNIDLIKSLADAFNIGSVNVILKNLLDAFSLIQ